MGFLINKITSQGAISGDTSFRVYDITGKLKTIGGGSPPPPAPVVWGTITGLVTNQTDLITYLSGNYYPLSSNPAGYLTQLVADGLYYPLASNPAGYLDQIAADLLYYPLSSNPAGYLTQTAADLLYYPLSTNPANYIDLTDLSGGTGISYNNLTGVITNSAPDQVVVLTGGTGISTSGTYPSFTITNTAPDQTVSLSTTGTGLAVTGTYPSFTLENTLPDQTVVLTAGTGISITGTYPSFTIDNTSTGGGGIPFAVASGTDTYTATISGVTSYADGDAYLIRFTNGNTDAATLNINSLGAKPLHQTNQIALIGGDIWDGGEMLCIYNATDNSFECVGTSPNSLFAYITNDQGSTITKGQAVYAFSGTGNRMTVKLAKADADSTSAQTIGVVYSTSIAANQKGIIIIQGYLTGLSVFPTSTWSDGDPIYLSPTTAGAFTKTKPLAPYHLVYCGVLATASNGSAGRMYVRIQNGYEMDELHDVASTGAVNNDILYRDTTVTPNLWKPASIATILGYTPGTVTSVSGTGTAFGLTLTGTVTTSGNLTLGGTLAVPVGNITATGTPSATTYLRGDGTWATVAAGGISGSGTTNEIAYFTAATTIASLTTATYPSLTELSYVKGVTSAVQTQINSLKTATIGTTIDGSGGVVTAGQKGYVQIPYACTINSWRIIANASGSIVIDVWKAAAPTIPTVANTITGSALPTLSSQQTNASSTLTGWTTSVAANDIIGFNVNSATTVSWVILQLIVTRA